LIVLDKSAFIPVDAGGAGQGEKKGGDLDIDLDDNGYFGTNKPQASAPAPAVQAPPPVSFIPLFFCLILNVRHLINSLSIAASANSSEDFSSSASKEDLHLHETEHVL
jgi:hypothetical protein